MRCTAPDSLPWHRDAARSWGPGEADALNLEHGVLVRQLAVLQRRWSQQCQQQEARQQQLEAEVVRLRGRLLQARTAQLWGRNALFNDPPATSQNQASPRTGPPAGAPASTTLKEAASVICQTGCTGHAHPWRTAEGLCQRTGDPCHGTGGPNRPAGAS